MQKLTAQQILKLAREHLTPEELQACLNSAYNQLTPLQRVDVNAAEANIHALRNVGELTAREIVAAAGAVA